jgi:CRISP-associated protein Cas1
MRPRCDPFDVNAVRTAIASGETTALAAYRSYASTAARPYARSSWEQMVRSRRPAEPRQSPPAGLQFARKRAALVKPSKVLTLAGENVGLSVNRGALHARDGDADRVYEPRSVKPSAIVLIGWGGVITLAALRFCAQHKIAVVILDWDRDFMTAMAHPPRRAARIGRAQLSSMTPERALDAAKALIAAKIEAHAQVGAIPAARCASTLTRLKEVATARALLMIEAQAARHAWADRAIVMRWREAGRIPPSWKLPYSQRRRLDRTFARHATDPINAMLNLALMVTVGRLVVTLQAHGFNPAIGVLHTSPRWPLAYDVIEPLRPQIEAAVFSFIDGRAFAPDEFIRVSDGTVKTSGHLSAEFLDAVALSQGDLDAAVFRFERLLQLQT